MKNRIALHTEPQKTAIISLAFTLLSHFFMLILMLSVNKDVIQLNSLLHSDYDYSVTMQDPVLQNDYYQFNAGIEFALSTDAQTSLNADIVMRSEDSTYTDMIYWNADTISENGVAISKNLAQRYDLHLGDKLYSKHIVNGENCEYSIEQIVPETVNVRLSKGISHYDGIIIMGYDELYVDNITHSCIVFTKNSINDLSVIGSPENIVYREDEISASMKGIISYIVIVGVSSVTITLVLVLLLKKYISSNFRRLIMLGFERKQLNKVYYRLINGVTLISIVASLALSSIVFLIVNFSILKLLLLLFISLMELVTVFIASGITNKRLWRK